MPCFAPPCSPRAERLELLRTQDEDVLHLQGGVGLLHAANDGTIDLTLRGALWWGEAAVVRSSLAGHEQDGTAVAAKMILSASKLSQPCRGRHGLLNNASVVTVLNAVVLPSETLGRHAVQGGELARDESPSVFRRCWWWCSTSRRWSSSRSCTPAWRTGSGGPGRPGTPRTPGTPTC